MPMDMQLQRQLYLELCARRSKSLADRLVEWQQQQFQEEPETARRVYQDKVARLQHTLDKTPGNKAGAQKETARRKLQMLRGIVNAECQSGAVEKENTPFQSPDLKPNQCPCGARKEFCAMGDCVSMYCPVLIQKHKLSSEDFILCDDRDVFCTKHADVGIKKCKRCSNGFDDEGELDKQCCDDCCEMAVLSQLF